MGAAMASLKPYYVDGTEKGQIMAGVGLYHGEKHWLLAMVMHQTINCS